MEHLDTIGVPSRFTCLDWNGVLWKLRDRERWQTREADEWQHQAEAVAAEACRLEQLVTDA